MRFKDIRASIEVALVRFGIICLPALPRPVIVAMAAAMGNIGYVATPGQRRIGMANLDIMFGDTLSRRAKKRILAASYRSMALVILDILWFARHTRERIDRYVRLDPSFRDRVFVEGAAIAVTAHLGNWELLGMSVAANGEHLASVAATLKNPRVDELFLEKRKVTGQVIIPQAGAIRQLIRHLKDGNKVALVMDQNTSPRDGGIFVRVGGLPATMSPFAAALAMKTKATLLFGVLVPGRGGYYTASPVTTIEPADFPWDAEDPAAELSQAIAAKLEALIRAYPEYWCWVYKRWKHYPPGDDSGRYPFYSSAAPQPRGVKDRA